MASKNSLLEDLHARGLIAQRTANDELDEHLNSSRVLYCGFDPTADSLHIGSLVPLLMLRRFQLAGHKPIALVGGSTGLIGDPSFKASERKLQGPEVVQSWCDRLKQQIAQYIDFDAGAVLANNYDWTAELSVLDFLRSIGKHFAVNAMVQKESVKQRLAREGEGISFTEFSYMLLQSLDFAELYKRHDCTLQIGGSDQWGNITGGIDLTRRLHAQQVFGLTMPLITKSDGSKFGKSESGTIWLSPEKTSPYSFYQFWLNTADADVYRFLRYFTFLSVEEIDQIEQQDQSQQGRPRAAKILATEVTRLVHGDQAVISSERISNALFSGEAQDLSEGEFGQLQQDGLPCYQLGSELDPDQPLTSLLVACGLANSGKQVKDALARGGLTINHLVPQPSDNMKGGEIFSSENAFYGRYFLIKMGKKHHCLLAL